MREWRCDTSQSMQELYVEERSGLQEGKGGLERTNKKKGERMKEGPSNKKGKASRGEDKEQRRTEGAKKRKNRTGRKVNAGGKVETVGKTASQEMTNERIYAAKERVMEPN